MLLIPPIGKVEPRSFIIFMLLFHKCMQIQMYIQNIIKDNK